MSIKWRKTKGGDSHQAAENIKSERLNILGENAPFSTVEEYKALRTNVIFSTTSEGCKVIGVTSANAMEGKSITCLNLAIVFAETHAKVLVIDCDLRKPKISRLLNVNAIPGMSNVLVNMNPLEEAIQSIQLGNINLDVILSGDMPPNPSELLGSEKLATILQTLKTKYDYIFIDTPPMNVVADTAILSKQLTGVLLVVRAGRTEQNEVVTALNQLDFAEANVLGFVLNGLSSKKTRKYKTYGSYKYSQQS